MDDLDNSEIPFDHGWTERDKIDVDEDDPKMYNYEWSEAEDSCQD